MSLKPGDKAPDFTLPTDGGGKLTLSKLKGRKVILYFYPKDDISGCTAEAYGRKYMGIERATFLIDEKGVIRNVWRKVKVGGHVEAVLDAAKAI
jgi:peroxiredoxin